MIRAATIADVPQLLALMIEAAGKCRYKAIGGVDATYAKQMMHYLITKHGAKSDEGTWVMVTMARGIIEGYHVGMQQRIGLVGNLYEATDGHFYVSPRAAPFAFAALLQSFFEWAANTPRIAVIRPGTTDMLDDPERVARIYERLGFRRSGIMLERDVAHKEAA